MENKREHHITSWKEEALAIFSMILKDAEEQEAYEECAKIKANMDYIRQVPLTIKDHELNMPHPYEMLEDEESIFIRYLQQDIEPNLKKKRKPNRRKNDDTTNS